MAPAIGRSERTRVQSRGDKGQEEAWCGREWAWPGGGSWEKRKTPWVKAGQWGGSTERRGERGEAAAGGSVASPRPESRQELERSEVQGEGQAGLVISFQGAQ